VLASSYSVRSVTHVIVTADLFLWTHRSLASCNRLDDLDVCKKVGSGPLRNSDAPKVSWTLPLQIIYWRVFYSSEPCAWDSSRRSQAECRLVLQSVRSFSSLHCCRLPLRGLLSTLLYLHPLPPSKPKRLTPPSRNFLSIWIALRLVRVRTLQYHARRACPSTSSCSN
jgi:hypothetical protein